MYRECIYMQFMFKGTPLVLKEFYFKKVFGGRGTFITLPLSTT